MSEITVIALDAMGGDNAPGEMVKGAVDALGREQDIKSISAWQRRYGEC